MMMMMMHRVMCVLAVVLCCTCGYTMAAAAAVDNDSPSGRGVSRGAAEVSCGAGGALRVRPAAESEWLTCGAGSRVSACGKYADLCRQRTARAATTTTIATTTTAGQPKAVMAFFNSTIAWGDYLWDLPSGSGTVSRQSSGGSENDNRGQDALGDQEGKTVLEEGPGAAAGPGPASMEHRDGAGAEDHTGGNHSNTTDGVQLLSRGETDDQSSRQLSETSNHVKPTSSTGNNPSVSHSEGEDSSHSDTTSTAAQEVSASSVETPTVTSTESQNEKPTAESSTTSTAPTDETTDNSTSAESNLTQQSSAGITTNTALQETTSTTQPSTENTVTEAPTSTPSPVPNAEISNTIASSVQNKANVDSSVSPVWMRTAAPLLIVAVLFSVTLY